MEGKNLELIVKESGLEQTKAKFILEKFQGYFAIASEWEIKARAIVVTNENQRPEMEMARVGRLFLREKRIAIEKARKELKEQALREGKAIDGIANVLKAVIEPIEEYLEKQEKFVEIKAKEKAEALRLEVERKMEEERIAKEKAEAEEKEKLRIENEKLKSEAAKKEQERKAEAERQAAILQAEKQKAIDAENKLKAEAVKKLEAERQERLKVENELRLKKEAEEKVEQERLEKIEQQKSGSDRQKILLFFESLSLLKFPDVKNEKMKYLLIEAKTLLEHLQSKLQEELK